MTELDEQLKWHFDNYCFLIKDSHAKGELTDDMKNHLLELCPQDHDEFIEAFGELIHALQNKDYYLILNRIEKGEKILEEETDPDKRAYYRNVLRALNLQLEMIIERILKGA